MCVNINNTQSRQFQLQFTHVLVVVREARTFSQMREFEFGSQLCLNTSGENDVLSSLTSWEERGRREEEERD